MLKRTNRAQSPTSSSVRFSNLGEAIDFLERGMSLIGSTIVEEVTRPEIEELIVNLNKAGKLGFTKT